MAGDAQDGRTPHGQTQDGDTDGLDGLCGGSRGLAGVVTASGVALGADVVDLAGGHFPMLTRPAELAEILARIASGAGA
jgi:hypothetical protein